jgi:glycosyltransferase involved in cell wall biosynthesis
MNNNKKIKLCLNAMVANEAPTITRMLETVWKHIDYWVIQDNGSKDGTQDIIRDFFAEKGIPGLLYEIEWQYPGWNRDHTLKTCLQTDHGCQWILRMDADEILEVDENFDWSVLDDLSVDSYNVIAHANGMRYYRTWLWNADRPWFFQHDKRHETIHLPEIGEGFVRVTLPEGFRHVVHSDGQTWNVPRKFLKDALELEIDKVVGNTVREDLYHLWYVAKSYSDCWGKSDELPFGLDHSKEFARRCIFYYEKFMEYSHNYYVTGRPARIDEMAYFAFILMGQAWEVIGDLEKAEKCFHQAEAFAPTRNEHLLYLCFFLETQRRYDEIYGHLQIMMGQERVNPFPQMCFLIEDRCYHNTSNFLQEWSDKLKRRIEEPVLSSDGVEFDFE